MDWKFLGLPRKRPAPRETTVQGQDREKPKNIRIAGVDYAVGPQDVEYVEAVRTRVEQLSDEETRVAEIGRKYKILKPNESIGELLQLVFAYTEKKIQSKGLITLDRFESWAKNNEGGSVVYGEGTPTAYQWFHDVVTISAMLEQAEKEGKMTGAERQAVEAMVGLQSNSVTFLFLKDTYGLENPSSRLISEHPTTSSNS